MTKAAHARYAPAQQRRRTFDPKKRWISNYGTVLFRGAKQRPQTTHDGYIVFSIKDKHHYISRLVLTAFDRAPKSGEQADHRYRITDNRLEALRWLLSGPNIQASYDLNENRKSNAKTQSLRILCFPADPTTKRRVPGPARLFLGMAEAGQILGVRHANISQSVRKGCVVNKMWIFELDEDPDLDGEIWKEAMFGVLVSNKQRYKQKFANKVDLGPGRHSLEIKGKKCQFHRLVYIAFVGPIPEGKEIDHIDEKNKSNEPHMLKAVTPSQNVTLSYERGLRKPIDQNRAIVAIDQKGNELDFDSIKDAAETLKVHQANIIAVLNGRRKSAGEYFFRRNDLFDMDVDAQEGEEFVELTDAILRDSQYIPLPKKTS